MAYLFPYFININLNLIFKSGILGEVSTHDPFLAHQNMSPIVTQIIMSFYFVPFPFLLYVTVNLLNDYGNEFHFQIILFFLF